MFSFLILAPQEVERENQHLNPETSLPSITDLAGDVVNVSCFAYGSTQNMTGTITNVGLPVPNAVTSKKDNLLMVKAQVTDDGIFVCTIRNETNDEIIVENTSRVIFLPCKLHIFTFISLKYHSKPYLRSISQARAEFILAIFSLDR